MISLDKILDELVYKDGKLEEFEINYKGVFYELCGFKHDEFMGKKQEVFHLLIKERN